MLCSYVLYNVWTYSKYILELRWLSSFTNAEQRRLHCIIKYPTTTTASVINILNLFTHFVYYVDNIRRLVRLHVVEIFTQTVEMFCVMQVYIQLDNIDADQQNIVMMAEIYFHGTFKQLDASKRSKIYFILLLSNYDAQISLV